MKRFTWFLGIIFAVVVLFLIWRSYGSKDDRTLAGITRIKFQLQWFDQAQFAGFYVAQEKMYYHDENLEVEIVPGGFTTNPIQVVLTGSADIGLVTGNKLLTARADGYDVKALGTVFNKSIACFMSKSDKRIMTPYNFIGKKVAVYRGYDTEHILFCLLKKLNIDRDSVTIVDAGTIAPFIKGDVDVWPSYVINEPIQMASQGIQVNLIEPDNFGVQFYSDTFFSTTEYWQKNRETLKKFLRASAKGWAYASEHPDEAISIMYQTRTNLAKDATNSQQLKMLETASTYLRGGENNLMFYMNPDRWVAMENTMFDADILKTKGHVKALCDFDLVKESVPND